MGDGSRLFLGYSYDCSDVGANILSQYLGGVPVSLLFKKVREEKRLCYSIYSERSNMGLFTVGATVGSRLEDRTHAIISEIIDEVKHTVDNGVLTAAKDASLMAAKYVYENRRACERFFFASFVKNESESVEDRIRMINDFDAAALMRAAGTLVPECVYILKSEEKRISRRGYTKGEWID